MTSLVRELEGVDRLLADAMGSSTAARLDDSDLLGVAQALGRVQRRLDGAIVAVTDQVLGRDQRERDARLSTRAGCRDAAELLRRTLLVDGPAARRYVSAAEAMHRDTDITSGALLPARFPELAAALVGGFLSVGGFLACTVPIVLRDRECLIPGCDVPAEWCEIHHVEEHAQGGPTHTSNGVPLCWHHHRTLVEDIWHIRIRHGRPEIRHGRPEIRGPGWWDPYAKWRSPHLDYRAVDEALNAENERQQNQEPAWNTW